tara:strand:+ start:214 stop:978 length:765 start_codon:yes stop_codon:yes gene_type:complete
MTNNIYWERQRGNNCRIHSLNAFFGNAKISENEFQKLCKEYDSIISGLDSIKMDGFAECRSIISYIVDKFTRKYCHLVPINFRGVHKENRQTWNYERFIDFFGKEGGINSYFEFNKDHVWINKRIQNEWYKIDSLSGITHINKLKRFGENGYILVFDNNLNFLEIEFLIKLLKEKYDNDLNFDYEIIFYNLYHLLKYIKFEYDVNDSEYNLKISNIKSLFKIIYNFVTENRKPRINKNLINKIINQIKSIIISF